MRGMGRVWQAASTVNAVLKPPLLDKAAEAGLRSLFVGFENLDANNLRMHAKTQNLGRDYDEAIRRIHGCGVMVNGSFVFGMDEDTPAVFDKTVEWAVSRGVETATFHRGFERKPLPSGGEGISTWLMWAPLGALVLHILLNNFEWSAAT